jgi:CRISPR/Cas system CSM-associated protein Csm2 small subunit
MAPARKEKIMYIPWNKEKQKKYYGSLFKKFLSWNMDELELSNEEKQEIIEVFQAFVEALKLYK